MSQELQIIERSPANEVAFGKQAATALMDVVRQQRLARKFGGEKEHLYLEAWELLGQFVGISGKANDAIPIEVFGVQGAKAEAILKTADGIVVGGAVAYCMRDEANWKNKPWFQLASMAQTRALSKAFRLRLSWIAVLAGYAGTPAEEMDEVYSKPPQEPKKSRPKQPPKEEKKAPQNGLEERKAKAMAYLESQGFVREDAESWLNKVYEEWGEDELATITDYRNKQKAKEA